MLSDGSEVSTIMLTGAELGDIQFRPAEDFSGTVEFDAQISVTDTATTGTDQRDISTTLFFDVTAVNDEMTFTQNGSELAEDAVAEIRGTKTPPAVFLWLSSGHLSTILTALNIWFQF
ncbi:cadherin-like domain-containing protein [Grimontia hollisae]|uniref:cadherin-like domain-containing protein n=1 Tax=Grimontia hollisae TaxID=673 RepID=UPI001E2A164A|nr:cadherin-like domain-containing protein [Grimontia hollisae]